MRVYLFALVALVLCVFVSQVEGARIDSTQPDMVQDLHIHNMLQFYREEMTTVYSELENLETLFGESRTLSEHLADMTKLLKELTDNHDEYLEKAQNYLQRDYGMDIKGLAVRAWVQDNHRQAMNWFSQVRLNSFGSCLICLDYDLAL